MPAVALALLAFAGGGLTTASDVGLALAEDNVTLGPARACMAEMVISPLEGEIVVLRDSGVHAGTLALQSSSGNSVEFTIRDILRDRRRPGQRPVVRQELADRSCRGGS